MATADTSWGSLPAEIRNRIIGFILHNDCNLGSCAAVSRDWQAMIEYHNFSRIHLTPERIADLNEMTHRNRNLVRYIWLRVELEEYDCVDCVPEDFEKWELSDETNNYIVESIEGLFYALSEWEKGGELLLDISVYSPSDSKHWFRYLTFEPDDAPNECALGRGPEPTPFHGGFPHGWSDGREEGSVGNYDPDKAFLQDPASYYAVEKVFQEIMREGPFDREPADPNRPRDEEEQWWQQLPLVPAVTGLLLRQQSRRRWRPSSLTHMFSRFPSLEEIHYEPWREWANSRQEQADAGFRTLFESLAHRKLRSLVLFENFSQHYPTPWWVAPVRAPTWEVSHAVAHASLQLEHLSASFVVDASHFFNTLLPSWEWPNLTSLALTSQLLAPDSCPDQMNGVFLAAAAAAAKMPKLRTMEIWAGEQGSAALFRYEAAWDRVPATITCRGSWKLPLQTCAINAWKAVAQANDRSHRLAVVNELLQSDAVVKSHGDAINRLGLSIPVLRSVSLRQILREDRMREPKS